jgi:hypothetical protein
MQSWISKTYTLLRAHKFLFSILALVLISDAFIFWRFHNKNNLNSSSKANVAVEISEADEIHYTIINTTTVTFDWHGKAVTLEYGLEPNKYNQTVNAKTPSPIPTSVPGPFWEAQVTGLKPSITYHYRIGNGKDHTFHTAPNNSISHFTIAAEGDIGASNEAQQVQSQIAEAHVDLALILGDLTYGNLHGKHDIDEHFNDVMSFSQDVPYMPVWGNHEWARGDSIKNYKGRFDLPNPGTSSNTRKQNTLTGEDWYWFDYGDVRFVAYPEPSGTANKEWEQEMLTPTGPMATAQKDPQIRFIVAIGHHPAYSSGNHPGKPDFVEIMHTLSQKYSKLVLVVNGHSHDYERTNPVDGTVFVTVGTGGEGMETKDTPCKWRICPAPDWSAKRYFHSGYLKLTFDADKIQGEFICGPVADQQKDDITCNEGDAIDSFTIQPRS